MRLLTHNMLHCNRKGCTQDNYPLRLVPKEVEVEENEFNIEFTRHVLQKLDWSVLRHVVHELGLGELPESCPANDCEDETLLRQIHHVVLDVHVREGELVCNNCERVYPIHRGVPNMLLLQDEL